MASYDYRCQSGHVTESRQGYSVDLIYCSCGLPAQRQPFTRGHLPGVSGFVPTPTAQRYVNLNRAIEQQHEMVYLAEKHGILPPDPWAIAKRRIATGEVKAIGDGRFAADI